MKRRKIINRTIPAIVVLVLVAAGVRWWTGRGGETEASSSPTTVAKVERGPLRQEVASTGRVVSNLDVEIKCRASGQIIALPFDVSDQVKKGDLLLELDPVDQERLLAQSQASLTASEARVAQAKSTLAAAEQNLIADRLMAAAAVESALARSKDAEAKAKREEQLLAKKYSSLEGVETAQTTAMQAHQDYRTALARVEALKAQEAELETRRQEIKLAEAQVESDQISVSMSKLQLGYTKVYAPIDGVVSLRAVQIGQIIASGINNVGGGTAVMTISDLSRVFIVASVDESDIGTIEIGQPADITVDAFPGKRFQGRVERIAAKGVNLQNVVTFEVRIEVESENKGLLKPEMTANVTVIVADKTDVLKVPYNAVARQKGDTFVTLAKADGSAGEMKPITLGITDGETYEIVSGVNEGESIIVKSAEAESRWSAENERGGSSGRNQQRMMMRTMSGGSRR